MNKKSIFTGIFLTLTALAFGWEVVAGFDNSDSTVPWTSLIVDYVPPWITFPAIFIFIIWLPFHFWMYYGKKGR